MPPIVRAVYFSPTRTTETIAREVAGELAAALSAETEAVSLTLPDERPVDVACGADDVLVFGFPVYAGRVPELVADEIARLEGGGAQAVAIGLYGNRHFDDALLEAADLLEEQGFRIAAAGAFIGEHSMTAQVAAGRPDEADRESARVFGRDVAAKIASDAVGAPAIEGCRPYKERPEPADIRPRTTDDCTACGICAAVCPVGVIDPEDPKRVEAGCLRCNACVKRCPEHAKFFKSEPTDKIVAMLESTCRERKEPTLFL